MERLLGIKTRFLLIPMLSLRQSEPAHTKGSLRALREGLLPRQKNLSVLLRQGLRQKEQTYHQNFKTSFGVHYRTPSHAWHGEFYRYAEGTKQ